MIKSAKEPCVGVLVPSCKKYSDLWPMLLDSFDRYWPDCPYPISIYSTGGEAEPVVRGIRVTTISGDKSWSSVVATAVRELAYTHVWIWIDDLLLSERVNSSRICSIVDRFIADPSGLNLRLRCLPRGTGSPSGLYGPVMWHAFYRCGTVMSLWKVEELLDVLEDHESAWEFELNGSRRVATRNGYYAAFQDEISCINAVVKGRWNREFRNRLSGYRGFQQSARSSLGVVDMLGLKVRDAVNGGFHHLPPKFAWRLRDAFR